MKTAVVSLLMIVLTLAAAAQAPRKKDGKRAETATAQPLTVPSKQLMQQIADAWGSLEVAKVAPYYDQSPKDLFFDFTPLKYTGWQEYANGFNHVFAGVQALKIVVTDDAEVHQSGDMAYGAAIIAADLRNKDGSEQALVGRWTAVWEKKGDNWLIVHDHWSAPLPEAEKK
jgi:ketosteroid isomerase-like protein